MQADSLLSASTDTSFLVFFAEAGLSPGNTEGVPNNMRCGNGERYGQQINETSALCVVLDQGLR